MKHNKIRRAALAACGALAAWPAIPWAQQPAGEDAAAAPTRQLGIVVVTGGRAGNLPSAIPTTMEGISGEELRRTINATDSEDALKYFPSLLVRKRYIGDYNHAVLSTRASGTGNSARSLVYADGVLLSNLLGNGASFTPRWGLVTPEEIERVDVLYGPFAAAYPGNSAGAVVDYVTRMPTAFEAHARVGTFVQPFELYQTKDTYTGWQAATSLGSREGAFAWWLNVSRLDSEGQPLVFTTSTTPVSGGTPDHDRFGRPWTITGTSSQVRTVQDHLKLKLAYAFTPTLRGNLLLGAWHNDATGFSQSYVDPAQAGIGNHDGSRHHTAAFTLRQRGAGSFDWDLAASVYRYGHDRSARGTTGGGTGTLTDLGGTGWDTLAWRTTWRVSEGHVIDAGVQQDRHRLRTMVLNSPAWQAEAEGAVASRFDGETQAQALHAQDAWRLAPDWMAVLGLRAERWVAERGYTQTGANAYAHPSREETDLSPKAAISYQAGEGWVLKASTGRAVRYPTVSELYQGAATSTGISTIANPALRAEKSWTTELSSTWEIGQGGGTTSNLRWTFFHEDTRDALYSQPLAGSATVSSVQNVDRIRTLGVEAAAQAQRVLPGLDLQGSLTFADSRIVENAGYVSVPGDTLDKQQPRVPRWRATVLASWQPSERWTTSLGVRYSGRQYTSLDNTDFNGHAYMGSSRYMTADLRVRWTITRQWHAAFGIDNLNNDKYWNFHPYPQRTYSAELQFDL